MRTQTCLNSQHCTGLKPRWITPSIPRPLPPFSPFSPFPPLFPQVNDQARGRQGGEAEKDSSSQPNQQQLHPFSVKAKEKKKVPILSLANNFPLRAKTPYWSTWRACWRRQADHLNVYPIPQPQTRSTRTSCPVLRGGPRRGGRAVESAFWGLWCGALRIRAGRNGRRLTTFFVCTMWSCARAHGGNQW